MHGVRSGCSLLVNAEVDSMGGVVGNEDGIGTKTSPHQAAIEIAQAELRLEYDVREERRRELEFLEKGGDPLDFRFTLAASLSVQSTSVADQIHDQFVTSEAKGSFAVANSPRGDSVGSSGRLGTTQRCEPNSADNFDGENVFDENEGRAICPGRSRITPSEHSSQHDGSQHVKELEGSPSFQPNKAYKRRNRSKAKRDTARFSSTDIASHGGLNPSLSSGPLVFSKAVMHEPLFDTEMDVANAATLNPSNGCISEGKVDTSTSKDLQDMQTPDVKDDGVLDAIMTSRQLDAFVGIEETIPAVGKCPSCSGSVKPEDDAVPEQVSEPKKLQGDGQFLQSEDVVNNVTSLSKGLDSGSSCTQPDLSVDGNGNMDGELCTSLKNVGNNGDENDNNLPIEQTTNSKDELVLEEKKVICTTEDNSCLNDNHIPQSFRADSYPDKDEEETGKNQSSAHHEANSPCKSEDMQPNQLTSTKLEYKQGLSTACIPESEHLSQEKLHSSQDPSDHNLTKAGTSEPVALDLPPTAENQKEVVDKAHEDRILGEAQIIQVKRKRIKELSMGPIPKEYRRKSHWDFVLEEMAWMANDFFQERLWKRAASSQLSQRAALASQVKFEGNKKQREDKTVAQSLTRAVMEFWQSAGLSLKQTGIISGFEPCGDGKMESENKSHHQNANRVNGGLAEEPNGENTELAVQRYVVRFMQHNSSAVGHVKYTEAFETPEIESPNDMPEMASLDQGTDEDLCYIVPHGAMEAYRKSIEIYTVQCEKAGKNMLEDADTSMNDSLTEFGSQENEYEYEEDEGESMYHISGAFGGRKQPKYLQKRGRNPKSYTPKFYEVDRDFPYDQCIENKNITPHSFVLGKRPSNGINGPIPTKRVRTASRQRVVGPSMGGAGFTPVSRRPDASSGDTNSFQDDQTMHGFVPRGLEVESRMDFDKQSTFDSAETTVKHKKKKKNKYQGEANDHRWQVDANIQGEQKDHFKRRADYHPFEPNGNSGLLAPHSKKLKITKQSADNTFENTSLMSGSAPSPLGSQMSNMSNQNKLIRLIGGRDRGRKAKALKMASVQTGSGSPWSLFEDQALVVLVHDMGPNWELVSDAINSTLYFKCIFRKPKECKERHKVLIEKSCGDGADSAEDSGSSQPYPSTLPGIPKGGARQLFQQLRGPMEEDTIKSHFEKLILLGQQLHGRKKQEPKQLVPVHSSHASALLQVIPNKVNGGVLSPLDLCDMVASSPDVFSVNYQSPHSGGLSLTNQGGAQPALPSGTNSLLQGSPGMGHPSNPSSPSAQLNSALSGGRYGVPRTSLPVNEPHRVQQYNHMLSGRNIHQPNTPVSGAFSGSDRGLKGSGMVMPGMNRIPRPGGPQGISSSSLMNSANTVAPNMPIHSGVGPGQGTPMLQPRDALPMVRAGQNTEHPRQNIPPEIQSQATQTNSQQGGVASFGGSPSTFHNQPASPSYPAHHLQGAASHPATAEQQAFAVRLARERQLQQRILQRQQQQQQFPPSSALTSHAPHHPLSNGTQNGVGGTIKQRQRPAQQQLQSQLQQSSARHHPQQQAKLSKGFGKGNMPMHHNVPMESSVQTSNQSMIPSGILSRNHQQLKVHPSPSAKLVNSNSQPTSQRAVSQKCVSEAEQLSKPPYDQSRVELPLANTPPNSNLK